MTTSFTKRIPAGGKWSGRISRGKSITFTAMEEGANVSLLLYYAHDTAERYNMPDTLKAQHTAHLTTGNVLMSDNGRVLASITADSLGWHDTISGYASRSMIDACYGKTTYQEKRNDWYRSGEENFAVELFRNGLTARDVVPVMNLFSKVYCTEDGAMHFVSGHAKKGDHITLRTELDVLLILSNTPNPLDPAASYPSVPVEVTITDAAPVQKDDICLNHRPENRRAFENTWDHTLLTEGGVR
ncbi:urea amidolyase associated protein UAAP1 [Domibacillus indicus]|uniref:urea amidolyase associated protein UAAP1 n=1 Tax=Domibacillus indicus TaxID=1437523 RepID=UPI000617FCA2|nr:urea amidolyase associated protein UAAP1 [Domibacillus indicus]